ncbi:[FeFe] hydrogenase H-cluster radical SAM maturase HydE [Clostridium tertium]|jgi:biotin synthase|uniref:[FeFe] hydrogenase H-cluster radical SAM maturase HydE n=4 Tax=Bacillota TaxID=1239 RepID=A0A9X3XNM8_9CLOT|nr:MULTISPECIES: [FeFe] hydrogenase H-cluster radical SAM maturase HydE [Clostridium]EEH98500.1 iron-only hydrogenase maturation rSAM protein HydE [Clostridium sp. 7_2_43FAA]MBP1866636.1 biotin synthase [Clostridium tertium]MBS5307525.1 [FeFe] hydrogenase H-cluster radical SAM maturase HydE [Clostridium sp.]MBS6502509.1 [FeFe] hydrogenase H-cluster radical SAM maturase HydE [Clostridium sp.]MBU6137091.1 [FeFe] hydrogenase H-cluster radical SAM maturase HydE [Clostridium tertium]
MQVKSIIDKLYESNNASGEELLFLLDNLNEDDKIYLVQKAHETRMKTYGDKVYMRGLIEFTNFCKKDCIYCGIRRSNKDADRYRLTMEDIMECVDIGDRLGYKTYVLQGGEDDYFTDERMVEIIKMIKSKYPNNAITLSLGERSYDSYKKMYEAGADRYLLRHETATKELYEKLHPGASFEERRQCLRNLKEIGYQIGAGFMVELPKQTNKDLVNDLLFVKELEPHMCGIGPFIPHKDTPLKNEKAGTVEKTTTMLALIRLLLPNVLLPSTTALGSIDPTGREKGIKAGGNVVMPNLSPTSVREKYSLYDGKICTGDEAAECRNCIEGRINKAGFKVEVTRGDNMAWRKENAHKFTEVIDKRIQSENIQIIKLNK